MNKILDKIITGFFVITLGALWYCSVRCYVKPNQYRIIVYDIFGKQVEIEGVRTNFKTNAVAQSYISEYQKRFTHYFFSMATEIPEIKRNTVLKIFKKNYR